MKKKEKKKEKEKQSKKIKIGNRVISLYFTPEVW